MCKALKKICVLLIVQRLYKGLIVFDVVSLYVLNIIYKTEMNNFPIFKQLFVIFSERSSIQTNKYHTKFYHDGTFNIFQRYVLCCHGYIDMWSNMYWSIPLYYRCKAKKKYMCVYCHMSKKSRVGRSALIFFFFFFKLSAKPEIVMPGSGIWFRYSIFEISGKPSFVLWRVTQFFYLLCSQFRPLINFFNIFC